MKNLGILTVYEWKKLGKRKILWAALAAAAVVEILVICIFLLEHSELILTDENGTNIVSESLGGFEKMMLEQTYARALDGRTVDDALLGETADSMLQEKRHIVREYEEILPGYGFASNKGYGSGEHIAALKKLGPTPIHRQSFIGNFVL